MICWYPSTPISARMCLEGLLLDSEASCHHHASLNSSMADPEFLVAMFITLVILRVILKEFSELGSR